MSEHLSKVWKKIDELRVDVYTLVTVLINRNGYIKYIPQVPKLKGVLWETPTNT